MVGGVLWALWTVGFDFVGYGEPGTPAYERYEAYNRLLPLALLPVMVGFLGLHAAQRRSYGRLGTAGFVMALLGLALAVAGSVGEFWVFTTQPYGESNGRDASWTIYLLGHLVLAMGSVFFGIATVRAKVLARKPSMMFAVLGVAVMLPFFGALIFAIPFACLGYTLWSGKGEPVRRPQRVRETSEKTSPRQ
jgi:drug/metabolite transporter (DMT)-like permease